MFGKKALSPFAASWVISGFNVETKILDGVSGSLMMLFLSSTAEAELAAFPRQQDAIHRQVNQSAHRRRSFGSHSYSWRGSKTMKEWFITDVDGSPNRKTLPEGDWNMWDEEKRAEDFWIITILYLNSVTQGAGVAACGGTRQRSC